MGEEFMSTRPSPDAEKLDPMPTRTETRGQHGFWLICTPLEAKLRRTDDTRIERVPYSSVGPFPASRSDRFQVPSLKAAAAAEVTAAACVLWPRRPAD